MDLLKEVVRDLGFSWLLLCHSYRVAFVLMVPKWLPDPSTTAVFQAGLRETDGIIPFHREESGAHEDEKSLSYGSERCEG